MHEVIAIGTYEEVLDQFEAFASKPANNLNLMLQQDFEVYVPMLLYPPISRAIEGLSGTSLQTQALVREGILYGDLQIANTRAEVTRWCGTSVLYYLYLAKLMTSGAD